MKDFFEKTFKAQKTRYILTALSYVFLTAVFFVIGYAFGFSSVPEVVSTPVSVTSHTENAPTPSAPVQSKDFRLILENSELRIYDGSGALVLSSEINEQLFPKSDMEFLRVGLSFGTLEEAIAMLENFMS